MKNILSVLLLVSSLSFGNNLIITPTPYEQCDDNNDGTAQFDLTTKNLEILNGADPATNLVHYFETSFDASANVSEIPPGLYVNINPDTQTIFVRVDDIVTGLSEFTTLTLIVVPSPFIVPPQSLYIVDNPFDGFATFDLTSQESAMSNGQSGSIFNYYLTESDMMAGTNPLPGPASYSNISNPEMIYVRIGNGSGCDAFASFEIMVIQDDIVFIPDVNFKSKLLSANPSNYIARNAAGNSITVDVTGDGEIQVAEAQAVRHLFVNNTNISSMEGILSFTNLKELNLFQNNVNSLNLAGLASLETLECGNNNITSVNLSGLSNLQQLTVSNTPLTSIDLTGLNSLETLWCQNGQLTSLDVSVLPNLDELFCNNNSLTSLIIAGASNLRYLWCSQNDLTNLDFTALQQLETLRCDENQITSFDLSPLTGLIELNCASNPIANLDLSDVTSLQMLNCSSTNLASVDISMLPDFVFLECNDNALLTYINMKNGLLNNSEFSAGDNPDLAFVCADEEEVEFLQNYFSGISQPTVNVSSYCSFTPGGNYNTVTGTVRFNDNQGGCDASDFGMPFVKVGISGANGQSAVFTNSVGDYSIYAGAESFLIAPEFENNAFDLFLPFAVDFPAENGTVINQNFCVAANGIYSNAEVVLAPIVPARPGFDAVYQIVYKNIGNQVLSGTFQMAFDDAVLDFVSASTNPDISAPGMFTWNYVDLQPFENRSVYVTLNVNSPMETPAVNIDDLLTFNTSISLNTGIDAEPGNNSFNFGQMVVGAYDPNNIACVEGDNESPSEIGDYLHYVVNFENTGNSAAQNIIVADNIDIAKFNLGSLQILNSSHQVKARIADNRVEFVFEDIYLASGGHGNILLKIKTLPTLEVGDMVSNRADIFFDYNFPVETNMANTTFQSLSVSQPTELSIIISPNPASSFIDIKAATAIISIQLFDVQGRVLSTSLIDADHYKLDISDKETGIYFLKVTTLEGIKTEKIVVK
jgi:uncharacterized repeat protein (TIGR01451 family)